MVIRLFVSEKINGIVDNKYKIPRVVLFKKN